MGGRRGWASRSSLFARAAVGIFFGVEALLVQSPDDHLHRERPGPGERHARDGRLLRPRTAPDVGLVPDQVARTATWVHTTIFQVPAHTRINVTIYQFDSGSPLRNQQLGQVTGTIGGSRARLNGKPFSVNNSNVGNGVGHTFSIPTLGISVPLAGNSGDRDALRRRAVPADRRPPTRTTRSRSPS